MRVERVSFVLLLLSMILILICSFEIMSIQIYQTFLRRGGQRTKSFEYTLKDGPDLTNDFRVTYQARGEGQQANYIDVKLRIAEEFNRRLFVANK